MFKAKVKTSFNIPFLNRISFLDKVIFAKNLSLMIKSGLPLRESVTILKEQSKKKKFKKLLDNVIKDIDNGQPLAVCLSHYPRIFSSFYINMIKVGEESGSLEENLKRLALHLEKSYRLRQEIKAAMIYPSIILSALIILSVVLVFFVFPQIAPIFKSFDIELPFTTRVLIGFIEFVQSYKLYILVGAVVLVFFLSLVSRTRLIKYFIDRIILKIPVIGSTSKNVNIAHFSYTLGILLKSGIPVLKALDITKASLGNLLYQKELEGVIEEVKKGKSISDYLSGQEKIFPLMVSKMIGVGEKTGNLEETLLYLGNFYEAEVDRSTKNLSVILEPILLLIIGAVVGFIALAIISPIYEITRGLHI